MTVRTVWKVGELVATVWAELPGVPEAARLTFATASQRQKAMPCREPPDRTLACVRLKACVQVGDRPALDSRLRV